MSLYLTRLAATAAAGLLLAMPAQADMMKYTADLTGTAEVPPNDSTATGTAEVTVDTEAHTVAWMVTVADLSGDPTAAHIHGPAGMDENAAPVIDMSEAVMEGSGEITDEQLAELADGKYYVNVHSEKYPDGEIRGQLMAAE